MAIGVVTPTFPSRASASRMKWLVRRHLNRIKPKFAIRPVQVRYFDVVGHYFVANIIETICALVKASNNPRAQYLPIVENLQDFCWEVLVQIQVAVSVHANVDETFNPGLLPVFQNLVSCGIEYV